MDKHDEMPLQINSWRIYAHLLFLDHLNALINEVETLRRKDPQGYRTKNSSKRLAAIARLMLHDIPQDPARREFQQGTTLGAAHRHWRRAKFFQQYRLCRNTRRNRGLPAADLRLAPLGLAPALSSLRPS